uniref:Glycosyl transferase CAP10 domain-containing protein n=1 Tax=Mycena chlorophos TaxID=658473 RepID=A0ABQ0LVZ2_MYCCL|nr:predicted protein [Mycena chlorophos]
MNGDDEQSGLGAGRRKGWRAKLRWNRWSIIGIVALSLVVLAWLGFKRSAHPPPWAWKQPPRMGHGPRPPSHSDIRLSREAHRKVDRLLAEQSSTLEQATARYRLRNGRDPPPNYDLWFSHAKENQCLVDEYAQIAKDFEPFYQLAEEDRGYFARMTEQASHTSRFQRVGMMTGMFENGVWRYTDDKGVMYKKSWPSIFERVGYLMPNMSLVLNSRDEPRVLFNHRKTSTDPKHEALTVPDTIPFLHSMAATDGFFRNQEGCVVANKPTGFTGAANDASAFLMYASSTDFTTALMPVMSVTKIPPCFSDILVPSPYYYSDTEFATHWQFPDNVTWEDKEDKLYWRGSSTGGHISGDNYKHFPRFRLIDISRTERGSPVMDVALSAFHTYLCGWECNYGKIIKEYPAAGAGSEHKRPPEEVYKYKYLMDVDGNSFSGRYFGLLKSGSLVFKSTVFTEPFSEWLQPFEHYIPVLPDLSDLLDKIDWARENDAEAQRVQRTGQVFAERVLTDRQLDCYFSLAMLEWGRLQKWGEEAEAAKKAEEEAKMVKEEEAKKVPHLDAPGKDGTVGDESEWKVLDSDVPAGEGKPPSAAALEGDALD